MEDPKQGARTRPDTTAPEPWLTIKAASLLFTEQGLTRPERSVRRYCAKGKLDCRQIENDNRQFEYRVRRASLIDFVKEHKTLAATSGRGRTSPDRAGHGRNVEQGRTDGSGEGAPRLSDLVLLDFLKEQLSKKDQQIDRKDSQIDTLNKTVDSMVERDRETNILIGLMQKQLSLGSGKPEEGAPQNTIHDV